MELHNKCVTSLSLLLLITGLLVVIGGGQVHAKFDLHDPKDALKAHEDCREDNYVPDDIYEQFLKYDFPEHRHTNCYVKCFVEKMSLFTERKGFDEKYIVAQFSRGGQDDMAKVRHGLEKCIDHNEWDTDTCTWANRVFGCWLKITRHIVRKTYGTEQ